jgi:hypothetical protein
MLALTGRSTEATEWYLRTMATSSWPEGAIPKRDHAILAAGAAVQAAEASDRPELRQSALAWARDGLLQWEEFDRQWGRDHGKTLEHRLRRWQHLPALSIVRDQFSAVGMNEEERQQWEGLWRQVEELVNKSDSGQ